jgi:hypothetical protein
MTRALTRQSPSFPILTTCHRRISPLAGIIASLVICVAIPGCSIKRTVTVQVPPNILNAKSATYEQLLTIIKNSTAIKSLSSSSLRLTYTSGKWESGQLKKYPRAPGYILLKRPDSVHLSVQNPLTKSAILELVSQGDEFRAWIPRENRLYFGKNSAKELIAEDLPNSPALTIRAAHIFEAVLPNDFPLDSPGIRVSVIEETGADTKYYIVSIHRDGPGSRFYPVQRIWIERAGLTVARRQSYLDNGQLVSDISYSNGIQSEGFTLSDKIRIDRPFDGYTLDMEFKSWRVNPDLPEDAFVLAPGEGAQVYHLREK